jgi:hypothetical protein
MANTREFRKNPTQALKIYSQFFLPMKNFLEGQITKLKLDVDIDQLYPINEAWGYFCDEPITNINRRKTRMKRKEAPDGHLKRPKSAFMWFITENRVAYLKANPKAGLTDVTKGLSIQWNALSAKEKAVYEKKNADDKVRFETERKEIHDKISQDDTNLNNFKPKKAKNGYMFFMADSSIREALKKEHDKQIASGVNKSYLQFMAAKWESLEASVKAKYEDQAKEDKLRYQKECETYAEKAKELGKE